MPTLAKEIITGLDSRSAEILRKVPVGELTLGDVNAAAIKVPSGGVVVAINFGLDFNLMLCNGLLCECLSKVRRGEGYQQLLRDVHDTGGVGPIGRIMENGSEFEQRLVALITSEQGIFILAHEFRHILAGHLDDTRTTTKSVFPGGGRTLPVSVEFYTRSQEEEFEADRLALDMLRTSPGMGSLEFMRYASLDVLFSVLGYMERAMRLAARVHGSPADLPLSWNDVERAVAADSSHPPAAKRREQLRDVLEDDITDEGRMIASVAEEVFDSHWEALLRFVERRGLIRRHGRPTRRA